MTVTLPDIIERLQGANLSLDIKGAADLASAKSDQLRDTVFVIPLDEAAAANTLINGVRQLVTLGVGVVFALSNRRDRRGQGATDEIHSRREQIRQALLGWQPDDAADVISYRRGRLLDIQDATVWWQDEYETQYMITGGL